ncbi:hypothetical protein [Halorubrum sp. T3]|uniref:hypothetical protein n=1 Tax=Halorubrum sp. T3 TaxID=1194088 RepID=UPI0012BA917A|nr:hypothetical protein [Halorubrum sp. T3]
MDDEILIGYQLERYHHIQNQAAKILGLILTSLSTLIALIGAVVLEVIEIPTSFSNLLSNILGEELINVTLGLNSLMMFFISSAMFFQTFVLYALIVSDSGISPDIRSASEIKPGDKSVHATIVNNKISINNWKDCGKSHHST